MYLFEKLRLLTSICKESCIKVPIKNFLDRKILNNKDIIEIFGRNPNNLEEITLKSKESIRKNSNSLPNNKSNNIPNEKNIIKKDRINDVINNKNDQIEHKDSNFNDFIYFFLSIILLSISFFIYKNNFVR
jgi:hypothetical protein